MSLINYVTRIHFAENVLEDALDAELASLDIHRPLVIGDHGDERLPSWERMQLAIPRRAEPTFYVLSSGPASQTACLAASDRYLDNDCDGLIGFGGAAAIDLAKAVGLRVSHDGPLTRYIGGAGGSMRIRNVIPPIIAVPTTAGSGAEASGIAVMVMAEGASIALVSPFLLPRVVVCDPTLTLDLPARQTAAAGMDALTHCMETFMAAAYNPPADGIAAEGLRRAVRYIERAVDDGQDMEARREMMAAALNGALAQQKGLGGVHAMSHALGGVLGDCGVEHGAVNAILLPHVLEFNAPAVARRYGEIKYELALPDDRSLGDAMMRLRERIGLPGSLSEIGITKTAIARAAHYAAADFANRTNPRKAGAQDYHALFEAAF